MSARTQLRLMAGLISVATIALGGCASVSTRAQHRSLEALATTKPNPGPELDLGTPTNSCKKHPYESLAPSSLPRPGHMPAATFMRTIQEHGRLVVGVDQNSLGLGYFNPNRRRMEGFDTDLAGEVARAILGNKPRPIRYVAISTAQRASTIASGDVDIVASAFSITCKRRTRMLFSSEYHLARLKLLVPKNSTATRLSDLRGKRVCATKRSTTLDVLKRRTATTGIVPHPVDLRPDCLVALQEGTVAAIAADDAILLGFQRQDPQTKMIGPGLEREHYGMAINKAHPEFVRFVNAVLQRLRHNGCLTALAQHWLSHPTVLTRDDSYARCTHRSR